MRDSCVVIFALKEDDDCPRNAGVRGMGRQLQEIWRFHVLRCVIDPQANPHRVLDWGRHSKHGRGEGEIPLEAR